MNFVGTARRLAQGDVGEAARAIGVPTAALLAVMEIEARGSGFDGRNRPVILFEPHLLYRELKGNAAALARAGGEGLAYAKWGEKPYPSGSDAQYARLTKAIAIDFAAGLRSCSWGMGQILGSNATAAGFFSTGGMVEAFMVGEREQLDAMCALILAWGLDAAMRDFGREDRRGEKAFALRWNGKAYARNRYDSKIATAFAKHSTGEPMSPVASPILRQGSKGEPVRAMQADLATLGFDPGPVDGRFGRKTAEALRAAQAHFGLEADGVFGNATKAALATALAKIDADPGGASEDWPEREAPETGAPARTAGTVLSEIRVLLDELETLNGE